MDRSGKEAVTYFGEATFGQKNRILVAHQARKIGPRGRITSVITSYAMTAACASLPSIPAAEHEVVLPPRSVPSEEVFVTAITDVCFEAVATGQYPSERVKDVLFSPAPSARASFKSEPSDTLYAASFASAPVLVSLPLNEDRCDVIAVRGDVEKLKVAVETVIDLYDAQLGRTQTDIIMALDESPQKGYVLKFSLYADDAVSNLKDEIYD